MRKSITRLPSNAQFLKKSFGIRRRRRKSVEYTVNGKLEGVCYYYFKEESLDRTGRYKDGKQDSIWTFYFNDGNKKATESYFQGRKSGKANYWYKNGNKFMTGKFVENLADSTWVSYFENGKMKSIENYQIQFKKNQWISQKRTFPILARKWRFCE